MISNETEYLDYLSKLNTPPNAAINIPSGERIYKIDLNTRKVEAPQFLSVKHDHEAEVVLFEVDRYFDNMDLSECACVVQYVNANKDGYVQLIPWYDTETFKKSNKMILPWPIKGPMTFYAGLVEFSFQFFRLNRDEETDKVLGYEYNLNTLAAKSQILYGVGLSEIGKDFELEPSLIQDVQQQLHDIYVMAEEKWGIYWEEIK